MLRVGLLDIRLTSALFYTSISKGVYHNDTKIVIADVGYSDERKSASL